MGTDHCIENVADQATGAAQTDQASTWTIERALRVSELSYRRLFEAAQDGILILDVETGCITDVNPFLENLLGFSHAEMVGKTVAELSPFKDFVTNENILERLQREGYVRYEDLPLETKDGRKIAVEFVSNVYEAGDKKVIQCNVRDITKRKQAEQVLNLLAAIVESSDDAIIGQDLKSTITSWNKGAEKIFGYTAAEMVGTTMMRLIPEDRQDEENQIFGKFTHGESLKHFETLRKTKDGPLIDVSVMASPIKNAHGQAVGVSKIVRDISARKRSEEQLLWRTTLLETQLDSSIDGILVVDQQGKRILQNQRMQELWKFPPENPGDPNEAAPLVFVTSQTRNPQLFTEKVAYLDSHPEESSREVIEMINGTILERNSAPVRNKAGKYYGRIWYFRDITESRKMEEKLFQAQKMESIGQLAGGIAHDFNNILSAIVGNVYLSQMEAADNPAVLENLKNISEATRRAKDLVNQILTFSRKGKQEREPVCLNNVVMEALKLLRASLPTTIRIQTELTKTPAVLANASAVHQVIMNLGTNAWHAMRDQTGVLKVVMTVMEVGVDFVKTHPDLRPGRYVQLSVSDTGCGMDQATLKHIFEPFFTTKAVGEGTGLGLAVVHGIMKSHDGGISVYSQPGEGTTFHLYFPVIETEATVQEVEASNIPRGQGERILFVDDEEVLASLGKKMLERLGYQVTTKSDALEAIAAVREQPEAFDLVITDLTMPIMDGARLGHELLQIQPRLPIIIMTGYSGVMTAKKARELGFRELLSKPSTAKALGEVVHRVLQQTASMKR